MKKKIKVKYPCIAKVQLPEGYEKEYPFKNGDRVLVLGEISNMPGHMVLVDRENKIFWGYHKEDFIILTDEET